jgi:hypothetical protein
VYAWDRSVLKWSIRVTRVAATASTRSAASPSSTPPSTEATLAQAGCRADSLGAGAACIKAVVKRSATLAVAVAVATLAVFATGCINKGEMRVLPPRPAPAQRQVAAPAPAQPVPEGHGRLLVDTTDGSMSVNARFKQGFVAPGNKPSSSRQGELCTTPCGADLPFGRYELFLYAPGQHGGDSFEVDVTEGTTHVLRAPTRTTAPTFVDTSSGVMIAAGIALMSLSPAILVAGVDEETDTISGGAVAGTVALFSVGAVLAIWGYLNNVEKTRGTTEPGASTIWRTP